MLSREAAGIWPTSKKSRRLVLMGADRKVNLAVIYRFIPLVLSCNFACIPGRQGGTYSVPHGQLIKATFK